MVFLKIEGVPYWGHLEKSQFLDLKKTIYQLSDQSIEA